MHTRMALSAIGSDRPGIVSRVTKALYEHGCNIEDSSMTILQGQFAMILVVSVPGEYSGLGDQLQGIADDLDLVLSFRPLLEGAEVAQSEESEPFIISVYGGDKPGIVHKVTQFLADNEVNITDVDTGVVANDIYIMLLEVEVPRSLDTEKLAADFRKLAEDLKVDLSLRPMETAQL